MNTTTGITAYTDLKQLYDKHGYHRKLPREYHRLSFKMQKRYANIESMCIANKINIKSYIINAAEAINVPLNKMTIDIFDSKDTIKAFIKWNKKINNPADLWAQQLSMYKKVVKLIPSVYASEDALLKKPIIPFAAWFRVVYCTEPSEWLLKAYIPQAKRELLNNPMLLEYLKQLESSGIVNLKRLGDSYSITNKGDNNV